MQVEIKIDETAKETKVIIVTDAVDGEVQALMKRITEEKPQVLAGFSGDSVALLEQSNIIRIYALDGKVYAVTAQGEYVLRLRLYELEDRLDKGKFVRISNSEIINLRKVKGFDLSFSGTISVSFVDGTSTFVSRRYVRKIKTVLGL